MTISSQGATLKWGDTAANVAKVVDIKNFPDLIGEPNLLKTTTLTDEQETNILGIKQSSLLKFTCNYDGSSTGAYATCTADEGDDLYFALEFSDGSKFTWQGSFSLGVAGKGVDEVAEFTVNVACSTVPVFTAGT